MVVRVCRSVMCVSSWVIYPMEEKLSGFGGRFLHIPVVIRGCGEEGKEGVQHTYYTLCRGVSEGNELALLIGYLFIYLGVFFEKGFLYRALTVLVLIM